MNQIKVLIVVAAMCVAALSQSAPPLPPVPTPPPVPSDSGAAAPADSGASAPAADAPAVPAAPAADAPAADAPAVPAAPAADAPAAPAGSTDGPGTCWTCGLETASCTFDSFTVPDGEDAAKYQKGSPDVTRQCNFCIVQKSEDPELNIKLLYRGCNDYDPTNGGKDPSYKYDQDGVTYTVTTKACNTALCNQN